ncbi:MAG: hypothetical protein CK604_07135 [Curvibacter sp. PD_MW3]|nr:MAG: hypothetical protein CK604_07135 [Curvibacter sp. PD_MW3]
MARQRAPGDQESARLTPEERFEKHYGEGGWDERRLAIQSGKIRIAKFIYLSLAVILPAAAIWQLAVSPAWTIYIVAPALLLGSQVFAVAAIKHAHWDYQIYNRSFISIREFMGRPEFWRFLFT